VGVTNREHRRRLRVLRKQGLDPLRPSKEGRAEVDECINGHLVVLIFEIRFNNLASNMSALLAQQSSNAALSSLNDMNGIAPLNVEWEGRRCAPCAARLG
jgi:hypothetical protein